MNTKAKVYIYVIQHENSEGVRGMDVTIYSDYEAAKKKLLSDFESNKRLESCEEEINYDKDINNRELPPRVENWIFVSPLMYIRTFTEGGKHIPSSRTERAIFEKELL